MTSPSLLDILKAARRKLLTSENFVSLIGVEVGRDSMFPGVYSGGFDDAWVFYGVGDYSAPERQVSNTGTSAVTLSMRDNWSTPNEYNTAEFPVLRFNIYSDVTRESVASSGLFQKRDAEDKCSKIANAIKFEFNDVANEVHWWDDIYIGNCSLLTNLTITDIPNEDYVVRGDVRFKLQLV